MNWLDRWRHVGHPIDSTQIRQYQLDLDKSPVLAGTGLFLCSSNVLQLL